MPSEKTAAALGAAALAVVLGATAATSVRAAKGVAGGDSAPGTAAPANPTGTSGPDPAAAAANAAGAPATAAAPVPPRPSRGCAREELVTGRRLERSIAVGGVERRYVLDVPDTLRPGEPAALLFDFHGLGHSGAGVWNVSGFRALAPRERFITVYPDGMPVRFTRGERVFTGIGWEIRSVAGNRDVAFTLALLDRLEEEHCIDRARVFATGFSNGGFFSHLLGCAHADRFAAVAPVSGGWLGWSCAPGRGVPVMIHHGRRDDVIDVAEARRAYAAWIEVDACASPPEPRSAGACPDACRVASRCRDGATVIYCEGDFAHRWPEPATARIWDFLRANPLPDAH